MTDTQDTENQEVESQDEDVYTVSDEDIKRAKLTPSQYKCVWKAYDTDCKGRVFDAHIFNNDVGLPICERHFQAHEGTDLLCKNGYDIDEITKRGITYIREQVAILKLAGLDNSNRE